MPAKGSRHSPEAIERMRQAKLGKKASDETRKKMSEAHKRRYEDPLEREKTRQTSLGRRHSEETKEKLRQINSDGRTISSGTFKPGHRHSTKTLEKLRNKVVSEESRKKMSIAQRNREKPSEAVRQKMSLAQKNRVRPPSEYDSRRGKTKNITPEWRRNMSKAKDGVNLWKFAKTTRYESTRGFTYHLQSSWELRVAKELDANGVKWVRPAPIIPWTDETGFERRYNADFYLPDHDAYLDTKNPYVLMKDADKLNRVVSQNNVKLFILGENQLNWHTIYDIIVSGMPFPHTHA